ncbi:hypothetical protein QO034_13265 [Sedimentitalea sp. JM2-8]|uniref:Uncharacterized protein n=1 Tax=Sedimentitalea xiamensis TaxID=3050037 RepID=A0ABT7FGA8_9RHOB|nr:hypothetical protein [Sedimentitalea xiamensis]MDK3074085.1 hypothetical protein [Sedimentitalea xiamensis]
MTDLWSKMQFSGPGIWQPNNRGHMYRRTTDTMYQAEMMMRGDHADILWRKVESEARKLIWC